MKSEKTPSGPPTKESGSGLGVTRVSSLTESTLHRFAVQLDSEIAECERDLRIARLHLDQLKKARRQIKIDETTVDEADSSLSAHKSQQRRRRKGSLADTVRVNVRRYLREAGHPLKRGEILELLAVDGISVSSRNPGKRVGKIMWDAEDFVHTGKGYWFADKPAPPMDGTS